MGPLIDEGRTVRRTPPAPHPPPRVSRPLRGFETEMEELGVDYARIWSLLYFRTGEYVFLCPHALLKSLGLRGMREGSQRPIIDQDLSTADLPHSELHVSTQFPFS